MCLYTDLQTPTKFLDAQGIMATDSKGQRPAVLKDRRISTT